jgi:hypothetical protein
MTTKDLLETCREGMLELRQMEDQLNWLGNDGRPAGIHAMQVNCLTRTNHPAAASWQVADGLADRIIRKRDELAPLVEQALERIKQISSLRIYVILHHYYLMAETDEHIGWLLSLSRTRVTQLRLRHVKAL